MPQCGYPDCAHCGTRSKPKPKPKRRRTTPPGAHGLTRDRFLRTMNRMAVRWELKPIMNGKGDWFTLTINDKAWFEVIRICNGTVLVQKATVGWHTFPVGKSTNARAKTETLVKFLVGVSGV